MTAPAAESQPAAEHAPGGAEIIDGKAFARDLRARIAEEVAALKSGALGPAVTPGLATVLVGDDPASEVYVRNKKRATEKAGMHSVHRHLDASVSESELLATVDALNRDPAIHGILVQLPLPDHIDESRVITAIDPDKDVDGFHPINVGRMVLGEPGLRPCTPRGCMMLLEERLGDITGLHAVVIGRSNIVGKPMSSLLLGAGCTLTVCHSRTRDIQSLARHGDILVSAVGKAGLIGPGWVKPGATVIDVGINRITDEASGESRLVGDVDFEAVRAVAGAITPVPGGVGPMTIATLLDNTRLAARHLAGID